jgi:hypothetical protein
MIDNNHNIILQQITVDNSSSFYFKEIIPEYTQSDKIKSLAISKDGNLCWIDIDLSLNIIINNRLRDTNIYYVDGRIGVNRLPLFNYKVDIAVPKNKIVTALHIGDGSFGFSMGNGTRDGFIPEIIGIGSDENDAGLYFVGIAGNNIKSNIPLIVLDGRSTYNDKLSNRPIFGITSANYNNYSLYIDASDNVNIKGNILATDMIINNISLVEIIKKLQEQINELKTKIT